MKVKEVYYERLHSFGNFENMRIGARVDVNTDTPEGTLNDLEKWVDEQICLKIEHPELEWLQSRKEALQLEIKGYQDKLAEIKKIVKTLEEF